MVKVPVRLALALACVGLVAACGSTSSGAKAAAPPASTPATASSTGTSASASTGATASASSSASVVGIAAGGPFCTQLKASQAQLQTEATDIGKVMTTGTFATQKAALSTYFHKLAGELSAVESSMSGAPSDVQAALTTINKAYAGLLSAVDNSTSLQGMETAFAAIGKDSQLESAASTLDAWGTKQCGS